MDAPQHSVEEATRRFLLSRTVQTLLDRSFFMGTASEPVIDVASFLRTVIEYRSSSTATVVAQEIFASTVTKFPTMAGGGGTTPRKRGQTPILVSDGLWQAFEEAQQLRLSTGGNDQFVGLRYVLFVILTARDGGLAEEIGALFSYTSADRGNAEDAIARYCLENHEPGESYFVWEAALTVRQLPDALTSWAGPVPTSVETGDRVAPSLESAIALLQPDDPWALLARDHSGAELEANAFADMIVAREFSPPLAIGIFGDWGAGKSYFMRLLYNAVADNTGRLALSRQTGGITFCERVVQIRFNAWHYTGENLWASLVDHIFTSLNQWAVATGMPTTEADKLFDQLTTARQLMIDAASKLVESRRVKDGAAKRLTEAEDKLRAKQEAVEADPQTFILSAFDAVVVKTGAKEKLNQAAETLGLTALGTSAQALEEASASLSSELDRFAMLRTGIIRQLAGPVVIVLVALGTLVLPPLLDALIEWLKIPSAELSARIVGFTAPLAAALGVVTKKTNDAIDVVKDYRAQFDARVEALIAEDREQVAARQKEAADAEAEVAAAKATLDLAALGANQAALDYRSETGGERVLRFVRDRVANGDYAKHLGFIATVRKDFEELSRLLGQLKQTPRETEDARTAHKTRVAELFTSAGDLLDEDEKKRLLDTTTPPPDGPKAFERIILYVDDLDRCQPEQVIAVLQAIHLLLTFPLFVVFVAVDVRWLRHSLADGYSKQLADNDPEKATTSDYLEKVFQIPYWVRPFDAKVTRKLLLDRIVQPAPADASTTEQAAQEPAAAATTAAPASDPQPGTTAAPAAASGQVIKPLGMTSQERDFIEKIADALDGLPRRTLRFINTYWIIKGGLDRDAQAELEKDGYPALIALLAIAITLDDEYPKFAGALDAVANKSKTVEQVLTDLSFARPEVAAQVRKCLNAVEKPSPAKLRRYAALVARYSFHRGLPA